MRLAFAACLGAALLQVATAALAACPSLSSAEYDYIVVGAGAGGGKLSSVNRCYADVNSFLFAGPLAARLAINGYKGEFEQYLRRLKFY